MQGIIKSKHIDTLGLHIQLSQAVAYTNKALTILQEIRNELSYITSQNNDMENIKGEPHA